MQWGNARLDGDRGLPKAPRNYRDNRSSVRRMSVSPVTRTPSSVRKTASLPPSVFRLSIALRRLGRRRKPARVALPLEDQPAFPCVVRTASPLDEHEK